MGGTQQPRAHTFLHIVSTKRYTYPYISSAGSSVHHSLFISSKKGQLLVGNGKILRFEQRATALEKALFEKILAYSYTASSRLSSASKEVLQCQLRF